MVRRVQFHQQHAVVSDHPFDTTDDDEDHPVAPPRTNEELYYDENLDDEDEAYVYKHMRGGLEEMISIAHPTTTGSSSTGEPNNTTTATTATATTATATTTTTASPLRTQPQQSVKVYKPRESDAVLSCPCCFHTVCMDCQRHEKYENQFRAMLVLGVVVDWQSKWRYSESQQHLVPVVKRSHNEDEEDDEEGNDDESDDKMEYEDDTTAKHPSPIIKKKKKKKNTTKWLVPNHVPKDDCEDDLPMSASLRPGVPPFEPGEYFTVMCEACHTTVAALDMRDEVYHFSGCLESAY